MARIAARTGEKNLARGGGKLEIDRSMRYIGSRPYIIYYII
eukprot:COSAG01_NODE_151_length_23939_cov_24.482802_21_plen_41_part_00